MGERVEFFFLFQLYTVYFHLHTPLITMFLKLHSTLIHLGTDKTKLLVSNAINKA